MNLNSEKIKFRPARNEDMDLLYGWANNPDVRKNSFHTENIPYEDHVRWFTKLMNDESQIQFIMTVDDKPAGQIRFNIENDIAEIDYSIDSSLRGKGYGSAMLGLSGGELKKYRPGVKLLIGKVKKNNNASMKCFIECGYKETKTEEEYIQYELNLCE